MYNCKVCEETSRDELVRFLYTLTTSTKESKKIYERSIPYNYQINSKETCLKDSYRM